MESTPSGKVADELEELMLEASRVFSDYVRSSRDTQAPVIPRIDKLDLTIPKKDGIGTAGIWDDIRTICGAATNTWSERFLYKLYASPTPIGVVGEALVGLLNNNAHVFQASPIGALIEDKVGRQLAELAKFPVGTAAGLTFPGGSYSNMHALMVARNRKFPELKRGGFASAMAGSEWRQPMIFTSAHAHYSIEKAAVAAGIGLDNVVSVPTDADGRMDSHALRMLVERAIADGGAPFFVNATAGTTVLGAFDPIDEIAAVCVDHGLWLHVDGSWGGPLALFCSEENDKFGGYRIDYADSFTVNPHKLMGVPLQCSFLLMRDGLAPMREALGLRASYLFHGGPLHALDDVGDVTMGCGRRPDAIKLWLAWRYYGTEYFRRRLASARRLAMEFADMVSTRPPTALGCWRLAAVPQSTCVCFWFVPSQPDAHTTPLPSWGHATRLLCTRLNSLGHVLIDYATVDLPAGSLPAFFRLPLNSPHVTKETLASVLSAIEQTAGALLDEDPRCFDVDRS